MRLLPSTFVMAVALCAIVPPLCRAQPNPIAVDAAADFTAFWDASRELPMAERVAAFHRIVEPTFPEFYDAARFAAPGTPGNQDARIAAAIAGFPAIRPKYLAKVAAFKAALAENMATFVKAFPDYVPTVPFALVHSLGEMDGGERTLKGENGANKDWLIFGADVMAQVHDFPEESAFFHHELFHTYHHAADGCATVICALWQEGLAVYVASVLHPKAGLPELLLNIPANMVPDTDARRKQSFAQLQGVLDSTDEKVLGALFMSADDGSGLPPRRGYYLGLLVAREVGKGRTLVELAHMPMTEAGSLIRAEIARQVR